VSLVSVLRVCMCGRWGSRYCDSWSLCVGAGVTDAGMAVYGGGVTCAVCVGAGISGAATPDVGVSAPESRRR